MMKKMRMGSWLTCCTFNELSELEMAIKIGFE